MMVMNLTRKELFHLNPIAYNRQSSDLQLTLGIYVLLDTTSAAIRAHFIIHFPIHPALASY